MASPTKQDSGNSLDLVDIKEIKGSTVIVKDGSYRQVIMVGGVNFSLKSEGERSAIIQGYQTFINGIDFPLQILIHSRKVNIDDYVQTLLKRKESEQSPLLKSQIDEYTQFIKGFVEKNAIMEKVFLVIVSFYPNTGIPGASSFGSFIPFFGKKKADPKDEAKNSVEAEKVFDENVAQMSQRVAQVVAGLSGIGLETAILDNEQLVELYYNFYNPQTIERKDISLAQ